MNFVEDVTGQAIISMAGREKFLIINLENKNKIILHLRMTGCLLVTPSDYQLEKHTHIIMQLSNGMELRFSDTCRFGRFWLIRNDEKDTYSGIEKLGLAPLSAGYNAEYPQSRLEKRKKAIKECLLDQSVIAGIGNIYSDEILFASRIHPETRAGDLSDDDLARILRNTKEILQEAIARKGTTIRSYTSSLGIEGEFQNRLRVHTKDGTLCRESD